MEPWLAAETWRDCWGRAGVYVAEVWWAALGAGNCSGGSTMGDLDRLRTAATRDRLRDRPRMREVRAPKNDSSAGLVGDRKGGEKVDVGDSMPGEAVPDD